MRCSKALLGYIFGLKIIVPSHGDTYALYLGGKEKRRRVGVTYFGTLGRRIIITDGTAGGIVASKRTTGIVSSQNSECWRV